MRITSLMGLVAGWVLAGGTAWSADATPGPAGFGAVQVQLRLRTEAVDEAAFAADATATTLRTRLTWTSPDWRGWQAVVEADDIRATDEEGYASTANGVTIRPVIADPVGTELNRAVLEWKGRQVEFALGRQRLTLDDQRFVGNVGWRQNEQTYDGATLRWHAHSRVDMTASWVSNVNRVFGPTDGTQSANWHGDTVLVNLRAKLGRYGDVAVFWYGLDFDNAAANSNASAGATWSGSIEKSGWRVPWSVGAVEQRDHAGNATDYSAGYVRLEAGIGRGPVTLRLGRETLEGHATLANRRFQTPLATLHAFQGWADKFLTTPPQGVEDSYVAVEFTRAGFVCVLRRHDFRAEAVRRRYGTEWDASVSRKFGKHWELLAKYADYDATSLATDTRKAWFMVTGTY